MRRTDLRVGMRCAFMPRRVGTPRILERYASRCLVVTINPLRVRFDDGVEWSIHHKSLRPASPDRSPSDG